MAANELENPCDIGMKDWIMADGGEDILDDEHVAAFVKRNKAINTVKKTRSNLNVWYHWCESVQEHRKLEDLPSKELNRLLSHFFIAVRKRNGEEYEPCSLTAFQRSIDCHIRETGRTTSILTDREFEGSRKALEAKRKDLRKKEKGRKSNAAEALTLEEEEMLWRQGQVGSHSPHALLRTVWYFNTMHFGWRGIDEHRRVCYGDFTVTSDGDGTEAVEFMMERGTKTRSGCEGQQERAFNPRMYATGTDHCPVSFFKKYLSLRPQHTCMPDSPFYLQPANSPTDTLWYKNQPVGIHSLSKFMRTMAENAGLTGKKTNHSARKTVITRLVQSDQNPIHVTQLSGHKNLKSLDSYSVASREQQKRMSHIISGTTLSEAQRGPGNLQDITNAPHASKVVATQSSPSMMISGNNTVNIYINQVTSQGQSTTYSILPPTKKPRRVILDSSDNETY